ncbi:hypothetical protein BD309DRAFT_992704 [Dichomitus squalens]|uniref:Uncharacterized protein n=2 Tax=Dichomitus squalens TaxID=114155 RepID=A0A4Q9NJG6_9APHY|nr:uncharacterized protein DICSQDRAFT_172382 [Dichomitus squalens LYAD-421 SS1]EJF59061.1 hypothetical protein DICSQDRAFT_172382 [Dichomitus squalens LYAD-421 SS1]TBU40968.1 hypothetical protein BD309DRAFT_992704 [Dichomitus squalens]TBU61745.1 hypothetical protein BD310DRAFT_1036797 [Dichomitus squalens]
MPLLSIMKAPVYVTLPSVTTAEHSLASFITISVDAPAVNALSSHHAALNLGFPVQLANGGRNVNIASDAPNFDSDPDPDVDANVTALYTSVVRATDSHSSNGDSDVVPAVIAVAVFVVCVLAILKILQIIRANRLAASDADLELAVPRMWEVSPHRAQGPLFEGRWNEIMPLVAQGRTEGSAGLSRHMSLATEGPGTPIGRRASDDSGLELLPLSIERMATPSVDGELHLPAQVAVVIAMPSPNDPISIRQCQSPIPTALFIGVADV